MRQQRGQLPLRKLASGPGTYAGLWPCVAHNGHDLRQASLYLADDG